MGSTSHRNWNIDCKVYIGNLSDGASKVDVENAFVKYGPLRNVWVARNPPGFAFVEYEDMKDAEDAVRGLDGTKIAGARVRVEMSHGRSRRSGGPGFGGPKFGSRPQRNGGGRPPFNDRDRGSFRRGGSRERPPRRPPINSPRRSRSPRNGRVSVDRSPRPVRSRRSPQTPE